MSSDRDTPFPDVTVYGHGGLGPSPGRAELAGLTREGAGVIIKERGCQLVLHFASAKPGAALLELRLAPDRGKKLEPSKARQFVPQLEMYMATARAALSVNPVDGSGTRDFRNAVEELRQVARPGRGFSDDFPKLIAAQYKALVREGEKYPVKALAEYHHVTISAASRWVTDARRQGLIPEKGADDAG